MLGMNELHLNRIAILQGLIRHHTLLSFNASLPVVLAAIIIMCFCGTICIIALSKKCNPTMVMLA
jgi:hypothetical protein